MKTDTFIYLDHGATSWPKPDYVYQKGLEYWKDCGANPGRGSYPLAHQTHKMVEETRFAVARFFHLSSPKQVVFTLNATDSLNIAIKGIISPDALVYISPLEHNSVARPLEALKTQRIQYDILPHDEHGKILLPALESLIKTTPPSLVIINHCSNVNGTLQPLREIATLLQEHSIPLIVDAAQSAGTVPISFEDIPLTAMAISAHKGLQGPTGVGLLLLGDPDIKIRPMKEGGTGSFSEALAQPTQLPDLLESGTLNVMGIAFLKAALEYWQQEGMESLFQKKKKLSQQMYSGLTSLRNIRFWGHPDHGVFSIRMDNFGSVHEVAETLSQSFQIATRSGLHCSPLTHQSLKTFPEGTVRLSLGLTNTPQEIEKTVLALKTMSEEI